MASPSTEHAPDWSLLRCPRCQSALEAPAPLTGAARERLTCQRCGKGYPVLLGIPIVTARPEEWLERWGKGLGLFSKWLSDAEGQLQVEFFDEELSERGQFRVRQVIGALGRHRDEVGALMARAGIEATPPSGQSQAGPEDYSPETYFTQIHRDYGWHPEVDEVGASWQRLLKVLPPDFKPGTTVVMGAGTGQLAWQLATQFGSEAPVLALDINPLPFIVTRLLMAGEAVPLTELTTHPRRATALAVTRQLKCPLPAAPHLGLLLADALDPPIPRGQCDTVVAPWVVDEVPEDAALVLELAQSLLREGGSFVCTGPFLYDNARTKPSRRYAADEFVELVKQAGFEVTAATYQPEPYLTSPLSSQGRSEHVLYLHARKVSSLRSGRPELPAFVKPGSGASLSIPRPKASPEAPFSPEVVAEVAALIDGDRNLRQIAKILIERGVLVNDGAAEAAVRGCLKLIFKHPGAL